MHDAMIYNCHASRRILYTQGAILVVIGPTLLDLASSLSVDIATLSSMLLIRAVGMVIGTIGIGVLLDRVGGWTYTIITLVLASVIASEVERERERAGAFVPAH